MTPSPRAPSPTGVSIILFAVCLAMLTLSIMHYGTLSGALALGLSLGTHLALLRRHHAPKVWAAALISVYTIAFSVALLALPPVRVRQTARRWLPGESVALSVRSLLDPVPLRTGELAVYRPTIPEAPMTLGYVVAIEHQRVTVHHARLCIDHVPVRPTAALGRLLADAGVFEIDRLLVPGEVAIIPTNLVVDLQTPGDARRLAFDLPGILIVPRDRIFGRIWRRSESHHFAHFARLILPTRPRLSSAARASNPWPDM